MGIVNSKMDGLIHYPLSVKVKRKNVDLIQNQSEIIHELFSVRVSGKTKSDELDSNFVYVLLECSEHSMDKRSEITDKVQNYVDTLCNQEKESDEISFGGEDSSYDSDYEGEESKSHENVSRTVSDTLGAEFSEYVSALGLDPVGYTAKVEFGLKLGYTEKLVQTALCKLGPNPSQNELLAELIKLGAQSSRLVDLDDKDAGEEVSVEESGDRLRPIVIDGSNVAMSHGNKEVFSCRGIKLCVDWFKNRGHKEITVFVPKWRKAASRPDNPIIDQEILNELERERIVVFTPSRLVGGKRTVCYDDRYILRLAVDLDGIVVSNDNYRDLAQENADFRKVIEERTLMYSFVNDRFMPPDDPLGRSGPTLDNFLKTQPKKNGTTLSCPYGKKCTYGNKCKYHHPERGSMPHKSVTERLVEHAQKHWQARGTRDPVGGQLKGKSLSLPLGTDDQMKHYGAIKKMPLSRTKSGAPASPTFFNLESDRVSKSKSVENIMNERSAAKDSQSQNMFWRGKNTPDWQYSQIINQGRSHTLVNQKLSDPEASKNEASSNLHKKLERQLTLNPYDHALCNNSKMYSRPTNVNKSLWEHQNVSRIASAPDSFRAPPPQLCGRRQMHRLSSTSDSHINLCAPDNLNILDPFECRPWISSNSPLMYSSAIRSPQSFHQFESYSKEEARRKLHYHLSSIFPDEQVRAALQLYPNETKPQEICAAILAMFP